MAMSRIARTLNQMSSISRRTGNSSDLFLQLHRRFFNTKSRVTLELGSCYIPNIGLSYHPKDAHFVCPAKNIFGVADGFVRFQEDVCVYSQTLMFNALKIAELEDPEQKKPSLYINWPSMILKKASCMTKAIGTSTACILQLLGQEIIATQVGNSGFLVIRNGEVAYRSPMLLHYLFSPIYIGHEFQCGQSMKVPVEEGDVIVAATDGLFHNLFDDAILKITMDGKRNNLSASIVSANLAEVARVTSLKRTCDTPFWKACREVGCTYPGPGYGGQMDDITVVVGNVIFPKLGRRQIIQKSVVSGDLGRLTDLG